MKKVFYGFAVIVAVALIALGVSVSRHKATTTPTNTSDTFNADQLKDAEQKTPASN